MACSLFSTPRNSTDLRFKVLPVRKEKSEPKKELVLEKNNSNRSGPSSEAAARRVKVKEARARAQRIQNDPREERTVFVGNVPSCWARKDIKMLLKSHGSIESIRLRSVKVAEGERPFKLARRTHKQLQEGSSFNAYVVFSSTEEAEGCLGLNGTVVGGRHLRVDRICKRSVSLGEQQQSVFVGNLPFTADEEKLRDVFVSCGNIDSVRIVRDSKSGLGKGFGFIMFADKSGVMYALKQNKKLTMEGRLLRVHRYRGLQGNGLSPQRAKKKKQKAKHEQKELQIKGKNRKIEQKMLKKRGLQLVATKYVGKRRPDGTKNRLYRLPPKLTEQ